MKKVFLLILPLLLLVSCSSVKLNPEWYPNGLGKDDIFVSRPNGKFNIFKVYDGNALAVNTDDNSNDTLLSFVNEFERDGNKVYIYSEEGYCVIDETTNTAKILVIAEEQYALSGTNDPAVTYLKSFNDFPDKAKMIFTEMEQHWSEKDYRRYGSHGKIYPDGTVVYSGFSQLLTVVPVVAVCILILVTMIFLIIRSVKQKKKK